MKGLSAKQLRADLYACLNGGIGQARIDDLHDAFDELEQLRALTRCPYFALTTEAFRMYAPCVLVAGHLGGCEHATEPVEPTFQMNWHEMKELPDGG